MTYTHQLLVFVALFLAVDCKRLSIDDIIDKHWQDFQRSPHFQLLQTKAEEHDDVTAVHNVTHRCVHERLSRHLGLHDVRRKVVESLASQPLAQSAAPKAPRAAPTDRSNWLALRIYTDLSRVAVNGDASACRTAGSMVAIGSPPSTTTYCNSNRDYNCYYQCTANDVLDASVSNFLTTSVVPAMTSVLSAFVRVSRVQGNLFLDRTSYYNVGYRSCGYSVTIPSSLVAQNGGAGIPNADVYVFVTARPAGDPNTVAYASSCNWLYDPATNNLGRTLAGNINFNPRWFRGVSATSFSFRSSLRTAIHEMIHLLGFSSFQYENYVNNNGVPYATNSYLSVTTATFNGDSNQIQKLITPRVAQFAREHFNCPSLVGMELEDYGSTGTAGSHWEARTAGPEIMGGYVNAQMPITALTMSLLEDTGWYATDYSVAEQLQWGIGRGCNFATGRCESTWNIPGYFCSTSSSARSCSPVGDAYGGCNYGTYTSALPGYYRHFTNPNAGGDAAADYCTYVQPSTGFCKDSSRSSSNGGSFGSASTCFAIQLPGGSSSADCYSYSCPDANTLLVTVSGVSRTCTQGTVLTLPGGGSLTCPSAASVCDRDAFLSAWPRVVGLSPTTGTAAGGFAITITGANFVVGRAYQVRLGTVAATAVSVVDAQTITATAGSIGCGNAGSIVDVTVTDTTSQNLGKLFASFTYTSCASSGTITTTTTTTTSRATTRARTSSASSSASAGGSSSTATAGATSTAGVPMTSASDNNEPGSLAAATSLGPCLLAVTIQAVVLALVLPALI